MKIMMKLISAVVLLVLLACACQENGTYPGMPVDNASALPSVPGQSPGPGVPTLPGPDTAPPAWPGRPPLHLPADNITQPPVNAIPEQPLPGENLKPRWNFPPQVPGENMTQPGWNMPFPGRPGDNMSRPEIPGMPVSPGGLLPSSLPPADAPASMAVTKLSDQSGIPAADIVLVSAENTTWGDASLGLPAPGFMYAQVLIPGYKITLQAGGNSYVYHAGWQGQRWTVLPAAQDRSER